jgi:6-pyruvoyl-tetrahydropterin synthase related domain
VTRALSLPRKFRLRLSSKVDSSLPASLLIAGTALLAVGTLVVRENSCGHDFDFHLLSWMEVARAWHAGLVYPHWVQDANYGAGEPRLIFYPPASWLLGGLLGTISGWHAAPVLFVLLALLGAGSSMYLLAREWAPEGAACFAACLYIANPYAMFVAYERSAMGELLAGAWFPLMVLFALRTRSSIALLGLSVAALWLTNSPAAVVGSYMLALLALGMWIAEGRTWPALRAIGGMALGLGLAAFYIVPAAFEQRWVQIERAITPGICVEDSFLFAHTADAFHDQVLRTASWILLAELAVASIVAFIAWRKRAGGRARVALTATLPVILLLQLPVSDTIWKYAPHMKFLQFPWRWLLALSVVACVLAAMALGKLGRWPTMIATAVISAMVIGGGMLFFQPCDEEDAVAAQVAGFRTGQGTPGTDEYTPVGADNASVQQHLPLVRVLRAAQDDTADSTQGDNPAWQGGDPGSIAAKVDTKRWNGEHWVASLVTPEAGYAVPRLMDYPSWRVTVDGKPSTSRPVREDGLMAIPVTAGSHAIEVRWTASRDVIAGRAVSAIALLALAGVALLERRGRRV